MSTPKACPNCKTNLIDGDIFETLSKMEWYQSESMHDYEKNIDVKIPLSDYSSAAKACYAASHYGWSVLNPKNFMRAIDCKSKNSKRYWNCPDCNHKWQ